MKTLRIQQKGVILLESLIAILLFSIGILALIAMFTGSVSMSADAQYRTEATHYANRLMNEILVSVNHYAEAATLSGQVAAFAFNADPNPAYCEFSGGGGNPATAAWVAQLTAAEGLPGTEADKIRVAVNTATFNEVTITICWKAPADATYRQHVLVGNVS